MYVLIMDVSGVTVGGDMADSKRNFHVLYDNPTSILSVRYIATKNGFGILHGGKGYQVEIANIYCFAAYAADSCTSIAASFSIKIYSVGRCPLIATLL